MRRLALVTVLVGACGTRHTLAVDDPHAPPVVAPSFLATRWVPPHPTYVLTSRTVSGAQLAIAAMVDAVGVLWGVGANDLGGRLASHLHLNMFRPDGLAQLGIDLQGGFAVFSDELDPTLVAHLGAPDQTLAFFDRVRDGGVPTQSVVVDQVEIYTTKLATNVQLSWAVADDWLWLHLTFGARDPKPTWFGARPGAPQWGDAWRWAEASGGTLAAKGLVGFADLKALASRLDGRIPTAIACVKLLEPVGRISLAAEAGEGKAAGRIAVDLGPAAQHVAGAILAPPPGWDPAAQAAALGVQWNLDLAAVLDWFSPCTRTLGLTAEADHVKALGVRGARAFVDAFNLNSKSGRGAVSVDGTVGKLVADKLDAIPMRSTLESARSFGGYQGHEISIPFGPTLDYVVTDKLAIVAVGDGILTALGTGTAGAAPPLAAVDLAPGRLSDDTWRDLLQLVEIHDPEAIVRHLKSWQDGHLSLAIVGQELVLAAHGHRR